MFETIRSVLEALRSPTVESQERAYLEGSVDRYDLEFRERQIDQGLFRKPRTLGGLPVFQ